MEYALNAGPIRVMPMLCLSPCKDVSSGFVTTRIGEFDVCLTVHHCNN